MLPVSPLPQRELINAKWPSRFRQKVFFSRSKSATKFLHVKTVSNKVVRHSLKSNRAKMVGSGHSPLPEIMAQTHPLPSKTPIFNRYSLVSPEP